MLLGKNSGIKSMVKSVADKNYTANQTVISMDLKNGVMIESFRKLIDFSDSMVNITAANKNIYLYGEALHITSFSKSTVYIDGKITKIEIFEVK